MEPAPETPPPDLKGELAARNTASRQPPSMARSLDHIFRFGFAALFLAGVYFSGRLGIDMALNRTATPAPPPTLLPEETVFTLGRSTDPVYLAASPVALREFYIAYPSAGERASATLTNSGIRRITSPITVTVLKSEADVIQVRVSSGAIAGAAYWIHHSQVPETATLDPIIQPVPE
jgi:hypothetical protein